MNAQTQYSLMAGPAGLLELALDRPAGDALGTAVIAHPHPLHGGTMANKVVQTLARACTQAGWTAVRFNFRGVERSQGTYDQGNGELQDLLAVVAEQAPEGPLCLAGFSFGAFVAAQAAERVHTARHVHRLMLIGTATSRFAVPDVPAELRERTLVVHGEQDDVVPLSSVMDWARPQVLPVVVVPGGGHFFHGQLALLRGWAARHLRA